MNYVADSYARMRKAFPEVHPLVFELSHRNAATPSELIDILAELPEPPFYWDHAARRWLTTDLTGCKVPKPKNRTPEESP